MTVRKAVPKVKPKEATNAQPQEQAQQSTPQVSKKPTLHELNVQQRKVFANLPPPQPMVAKVQVQRKPIVPPKVQKGND